jgi:hypothetical protein
MNSFFNFIPLHKMDTKDHLTFHVAIGPQYNEYLSVDDKKLVITDQPTDVFHLYRGRLTCSLNDDQTNHFVNINVDQLVDFDQADEFVLREGKLIRASDSFDNDWLITASKGCHKKKTTKTKSRKYNPFAPKIYMPFEWQEKTTSDSLEAILNKYGISSLDEYNDEMDYPTGVAMMNPNFNSYVSRRPIVVPTFNNEEAVVCWEKNNILGDNGACLPCQSGTYADPTTNTCIQCPLGAPCGAGNGWCSGVPSSGQTCQKQPDGKYKSVYVGPCPASLGYGIDSTGKCTVVNTALNVGAIFGIVLAIVLVILMIVLLVLWKKGKIGRYRQMNMQQNDAKRMIMDDQDGNSSLFINVDDDAEELLWK